VEKLSLSCLVENASSFQQEKSYLKIKIKIRIETSFNEMENDVRISVGAPTMTKNLAKKKEYNREEMNRWP
jgi:hypothetical protein